MIRFSCKNRIKMNIRPIIRSTIRFLRQHSIFKSMFDFLRQYSTFYVNFLRIKLYIFHSLIRPTIRSTIQFYKLLGRIMITIRIRNYSFVFVLAE